MRNLLYILSMLGTVVISLAVPGPVSTQHKDWWKEEENNPVKIVRLHMVVPFSVRKGRLAVCTKHGGIPPTEAVYLISLTLPHLPYDLHGLNSAQCLFEVKTLNNLRGYVRIQTPQQALSYVRLLTSPRTFVCFHRTPPRLELEVVSLDTVTPELMFGDRREADKVSFSEDGCLGVLDRKWARRYPGLFATCTRSQDGFLVKRTLLVEEWNEDYEEVHHLEHVEEWVGRHGRYLVKKRIRLSASSIPPVHWNIPKGL